MASQTISEKLTFDQYLATEETAPFKSEYRGGEMFAMSGGTESHARLASKLIYLLLSKNANRCRIYTSDLRLYVPAANDAVYPDVMVICGQPEFYRERADAVLNPAILIEVLSPSSDEYDKGIKAEFYRQIPSLQILLVVDSEKRYLQTQTPPT